MRRVAAIFALFIALAADSQTGPPLLQCLEVKANGDVVLFWTPPPGPNTLFSHYEIWYSIQKNGNYALVNPTVAPLSATTAVHSTTIGTTQQLFYYIRSVMTDGSFSASSDTLRTIFLGIFNGDPALRLMYNRPGEGYVPTFTLTKEWPIGSVNVLTVTTDNVHFDVISTCTAVIEYQVELSHSSGCVSKSNPVIGTFYDTKYPDSTFIDSISVLPDGRTVLSWPPAADLDVDSYFVIRVFPGNAPNQFVDSLPGRSTVSYTFETDDADKMPVWLTIMAKDSCSKRGTFDRRPVTIHLTAGYNQCAYTTELIWNSYRAMKNGVKEYRVYYSSDSGATYQRLVTTKDTFYVHKNVDPGKRVSYFVRVVNNGESITASSNRQHLFTRQVGVPSLFYMSSASVNNEGGVDLRILTSQEEPFKAMTIQRAENFAEGFTTIATLPNNGTSLHAYTDNNARTSERAYYYRALIADSCGNERGATNFCRTMLLTVTNENNNLFEKQLRWTPYEGFENGIWDYAIFRVTGNDPFPQKLATTPANVTSYTDNIESVASEGASVAYFVQALETPGGVAVDEFSNSNQREIYAEGRIFVPDAFAPRGHNRVWKPVTHFVHKSDYSVRVFNRWGTQVFHTNSDQEGWDGGNCEQGIYVYLVSYMNARGEYREQKGTVTLLR